MPNSFSQPLVEEIENYAQNIVDTVREPLLILDATLRVRSANRAFYQTFQVSAAETEGRLIYELGNGQWDIPDLRTLLEDIVPRSSVFNDFELEHTFPSIGRRIMLLNARKLEAGQHGERPAQRVARFSGAQQRQGLGTESHRAIFQRRGKRGLPTEIPLQFTEDGSGAARVTIFQQDVNGLRSGKPALGKVCQIAKQPPRCIHR